MKLVKMWVELAGNATRWTEVIEEFADDATDQEIEETWQNMRNEIANGGWEVQE